MRGLLLLTLLTLIGVQAHSQLRISNAQALNVSGKQRMLTQRMGKCFLYLTQDPNFKDAKALKVKSMLMYEEGLRILSAYAPNDEIKLELDTVKTLWKTYSKVLESEYDQKSANKVVALNTNILKASNAVVVAIEKYTKKSLSAKKESEKSKELAAIINISGRQRMLSQRLTLYYVAYYNNYKVDFEEVEKVYELFDTSLSWLIASPCNNTKIDDTLIEVLVLWKDIRENQKLLKRKSIDPFKVYKELDVVMAKMNKVTGMYAALESL